MESPESSSIKRLNFSLPEFTRIVWVSDKAREIWEPRIAAINLAWSALEKETVLQGFRLGGLQGVSPNDITAFQSWLAYKDVDSIIIAQEGTSEVYGNASVPVEEGKPWNYRVYFGKETKKFLKVWHDNNDLEVGRALGYPICCSQFFKQFWTNEGWRDLTYPMIRTSGIQGPHTCNTLLRHLGVRPVFHLPCSFNCRATRLIGEANIELGYRVGFKQEMGWLEEMLRWPVRWSSLHGAAIITTPVVKIITSSDALETNAVYDRLSDSYPQEGATGIEFPFQTRKPLQILRNTWTPNGFSSLETMTKAHDVIIAALYKVKLKIGNALDLGCGTGVLMDRIRALFPNLSPFGIELDDRKVRERLDIIPGDLFEAELRDKYEIVLISLNRFKEGGEERNTVLLQKLQNIARFVLIYSYDPWVDTFDKEFSDRFQLMILQEDGLSEARVYANPKF